MLPGLKMWLFGRLLRARVNVARAIAIPLFFVVVGPVLPEDQNPTDASVVAIEVYGSAQVDFSKLQQALPFHVGEHFSIEKFSLDPVPEQLKRVVGNNRVTASPVFIPEMRGWVVFIDIGDSEPFLQKEHPTGAARLPPEVVKLYEHALKRLMDGGVQAGEDRSHGYSLSLDPVVRADQTKLIEYSQKYADRIYQVLVTSSSDRDRVAAAWCAGYTPQELAQVKVLVAAISDPNEQVRNNAMRVLAILAKQNAKLAQSIPPAPLIPFLSSSTWTDRNKALAVLEVVTASREPTVMNALRNSALQPLWQMARWTSFNHAEPALTILGRMAGIPEEQLQMWLQQKDSSAILSVAQRRLMVN